MIYPAGRYNLNFDICAMIISLLLIAYLIFAANLKVRRTRSYFWVALAMFLSACGELNVGIMRNDNGISTSVTQAEIATFTSHLAHNSVPFLLLMSFLVNTGLYHGLKKKGLTALCVPEGILVFAHVIPPIRHLIYYYNSSEQYVRGPLYPIYYFVVLIYILAGMILFFFYRSSIRKNYKIKVTILLIGYVSGFVVDFCNKYIRMTDFIQSVVLATTILLLENDENLLDSVTRVYDANALTRDTYPLFHSSNTSYILSIKLQDLNNYRMMIGAAGMTEILHQMGAWMLSIANENCCFYRVGHGEFAVLLFRSDQDKAKSIAEQISNRFNLPWHYSADKIDLTIPTQIWGSSIPDRISNEEQVLSFAESPFDVTMPQDRLIVADEMQIEKRRIQVNVAIQRALTNHTFQVYYQPIYDTATGKIHSCEALVRMNDPELGFVSPEEFIKVSEQKGTISQIGTIVFEKVCKFISSKKPEQYGMDFVEVNLSPIQCMDENLVLEFMNIMQKYNVKSSSIVLEITESAVIHNEGRVSGNIKRLHEAGFKFALDDFGTGRANYSYIRNFPFTIIKIDKSFLWAAEKDKTDQIVLGNMLNLVKGLNLQSVVEGVETEDHKNSLVDNGVNYLQGYYYSKPVPEDEFLNYIHQFNQEHQEH